MIDKAINKETIDSIDVLIAIDFCWFPLKINWLKTGSRQKKPANKTK